MPGEGYLPLSDDAQCAWEAGGREATTFGTGANGPVCLLIGLLQLQQGKVVEALRQLPGLTAERVRAAVADWQAGADETPLDLAQVRDTAQAIARAHNRAAIEPEDLLLALAGEENANSRAGRVIARANPALKLEHFRRALGVGPD